MPLAAAGLCLLLAAGGCGQKGALYLPDPKPQAASTAPATPATDEAARRKVQHPPDPATAQ